MDWYSRYVLAWRISNSLDADFCVEALEEALKKGRPDVFNTDQGSQFTGKAFIGLLEKHGIKISNDGKGSYRDNLFIERLWRTVKYEEVYLKAYQNGKMPEQEPVNISVSTTMRDPTKHLVIGRRGTYLLLSPLKTLRKV